MNKKELIEAISERTSLKSKDIDLVLTEFFAITTEVVKKEEKLVINSFGTFQGIHKDASESINPLTQSKIVVPAKTVFKFKPSKALKDKVA